VTYAAKANAMIRGIGRSGTVLRSARFWWRWVLLAEHGGIDASGTPLMTKLTAFPAPVSAS
jgi:hypothetical protein